MKRWLLAVIAFSLVTSGCSRYKGIPELSETDSKTEESQQSAEESGQSTGENGGQLPLEASAVPGKKPVKVKGIYISGYMAGSEGLQAILDKIQGTEINTVVIDVKNDDGRITFAMEDAPTVNEIGATEKYIKDIDSLMAQLKARGLYTIARVVAFRDPYLAEKKPEWGLKNKDGSLHRDNKGLAWVNPYRTEVWDYLVEVGTQASKAGFDEVQFDYIRFSTDSSMKQVVFDDEDTRGRSKTDIITEFIQYAYEKLSSQNIFVSADVFGTIIGSKVDAEAVGQIYHEMAGHLDYICPMIYPSHYGDGNFGIDHPDMEPYRTIRAALKLSKQDLESAKEAGKHQAIVRPWLQDFTASYLKNYIPYGAKEIRAQIQAVYDAGYDEWILWSASNRYTWDGFLTAEAAREEAEELARVRAAEEMSAAASAEAKEPSTEAAGETKESQPETRSETQTEGKEEKAKKSLEESTAGEETQPETKAANKKKAKPDVVIVTTGGQGN
ncbi:putative glycoside hydrolase [Lacrimispora indolis]|uniref:putative glycoside hydrolase n=1 Tax=Lacrimispora indolis TaxID=69825 RepID=UPI00045EA7B0|nr:putative glycoside hydrolase [Lacrimispora indolis]MBE7718710.1 sugar fermentation stimulation protein [Lacrimispora celerecrescens]